MATFSVDYQTYSGDQLAADCNKDYENPWFMRRDFKDDKRYQAISEDLKPLADRFMRDGFVVINNDIEQVRCDDVLLKFKRFTDANSDYFDPHRDEFGLLQRIINLHLVVPEIFDVFSNAITTLRLQDALFGARSSVYTTLYFERGSAQPTHRDTPYFTTRPEYNYFGTWFALEDANVDNGCLQVMRGGHLIPEIDRSGFARSIRGVGPVSDIDQELFDLYQNYVARQCENAGLQLEDVPVSKGDVLIWHPQLPHGGSPTGNGGRTRHSIVAHTVPSGCPVYQASAFFDPKGELPGVAAWPLNTRNGREFVDHKQVDVMHVAPRSPEEFILAC